MYVECCVIIYMKVLTPNPSKSMGLNKKNPQPLLAEGFFGLKIPVIIV
jgi:hypothetical protein